MKRVLKIITTLALLLCILSSGVLAVEEQPENESGFYYTNGSDSDNGIMPYYVYMSRPYCGLHLEGNELVCVAGVEGYEGVTDEIRIEMTLQKKGLIFFSDVITWSDAFWTTSAEMTRRYPYEDGKQYRLQVYVEVYHNGDPKPESDSLETKPFPS